MFNLHNLYITFFSEAAFADKLNETRGLVTKVAHANVGQKDHRITHRDGFSKRCMHTSLYKLYSGARELPFTHVLNSKHIKRIRDFSRISLFKA